jgi:hypothetical protein
VNLVSDFEDKLNKLLNDPKEMERFAGFAKSLMSGTELPEQEQSAVQDIDPSILKNLSGILSGKSSGGRDTKLLEAMRPFMSEKRRGKMDRAMKIARLAGIAELAAGQLGGDDDGGV